MPAVSTVTASQLPPKIIKKTCPAALSEEMIKLMPKVMEEEIRTPSGTFEIVNLLGAGSFGAVYKVRHVSNGKEFAMKCEADCAKKAVIKHEAEVIRLAWKVGSPHILKLEGRGRVPGRFTYILLQLVGKSLWDLRFAHPKRKFSTGTALKIAEQTLASIRDLHRVGFLHRDVKPPNFSIGRKADNTFHTIFILDFGMCRRFRTDTKDLRLPREKVAFRGTTRYASLGMLSNVEQCRKDDIESWWYMVAEWLLGDLPWKHCKAKEREEVRKSKVDMRKNLVTELRGTPMPYTKDILLYTDSLAYNSIPDYDYIYRLLEAAQKSIGVSPLEPLDWDPSAVYHGPKYVLGLDFNPKPQPET